MKPQMRRIKPERHARRITAFALIFLPSLLVFLILWQLRSVPVQGQARSSLQVSSAELFRWRSHSEPVYLRWRRRFTGPALARSARGDKELCCCHERSRCPGRLYALDGIQHSSCVRGGWPRVLRRGARCPRVLPRGPMISDALAMEVPARPRASLTTMCSGSMPSISASICRRERPENNWMQRSNGIFLPRVKSSESTGAQATSG